MVIVRSRIVEVCAWGGRAAFTALSSIGLRALTERGPADSAGSAGRHGESPLIETVVRRRKKSASRKAQLIDMAAQIFMEKGYKETGIEAILKQAGLTGPALYRHFTSKQEILDTCCLQAGQKMVDIAHLVAEEDGLAPRERMGRLIQMRLDHLFGPDGTSSFLAVMQHAHISETARTQLGEMQNQFGCVFSGILQGIRPELSTDERDLVFYAVQNMVLFGIWRSRMRGLVSDDEYRDILETMIWDTLEA